MCGKAGGEQSRGVECWGRAVTAEQPRTVSVEREDRGVPGLSVFLPGASLGALAKPSHGRDITLEKV